MQFINPQQQTEYLKVELATLIGSKSSKISVQMVIARFKDALWNYFNTVTFSKNTVRDRKIMIHILCKDPMPEISALYHLSPNSIRGIKNKVIEVCVEYIETRMRNPQASAILLDLDLSTGLRNTLERCGVPMSIDIVDFCANYPKSMLRGVRIFGHSIGDKGIKELEQKLKRYKLSLREYDY